MIVYIIENQRNPVHYKVHTIQNQRNLSNTRSSGYAKRLAVASADLPANG
jgi:hypothetical protein